MDKLLIREELTPGFFEEIWHDPATDTMTIHHKQDLDGFFKDNKALYNDFDAVPKPHKMTYGNMRHIARIPNVVIVELMQKGIWGDKQAMTKWLNQTENRKYRTAPGHF